MTTVAMNILAIIIIASCLVYACNEMEIVSWKNDCDHLRSLHDKCNNQQCRYALSQLVKRETRDCYEELGMGQSTDLSRYMFLENGCRRYDAY
jgi:hypothetical protein